MFEVNGKYSKAKVFTYIVDEKAISQIINICNQPFTENHKIRIMPDVHAGSDCVIGTTMTIKDKVCPNLVSGDIGCGVITAKLKAKTIDFDNLDYIIRNYVPSGFTIHDTPTSRGQKIKKSLDGLKCIKAINIERAQNSIGTLGGGNHFIEIDKDTDGNLYLVIHTGSRHMGIEIAKHYQNLAIKELNTADKNEINKIIETCKQNGKQREIEARLKDYYNTHRCSIPDNMCYLTGDSMQDYLNDMHIAQNYAVENRLAIMYTIIERLGTECDEYFEIIHNYIDMKDNGDNILRKGAVSAEKDKTLLIPINMRDGSLICKGKGNPDWNYSAPHGAGRLMSRAQAKETLSLDDFETEMQNVWTTSVNQNTIDESPMAYKSAQSIIENIEPSVEIEKIIKPVYNFKA